MNLLLIILATVLFAIVSGFLSQYYKSKIVKTISITISILFVLSFYYFLSANFLHPKVFKPTKNLLIYTDTGNYYNLVLNAFKKGNLHISDSIKYPILKEKDIYKNFPRYTKEDINLLHLLLDTSYYNNKIYFYFGITPVLLFYAPFNLITGFFLTDKYLVFILSSFIFIFSLLIIKIVTKKIINKKIPFYIEILTMFLIGFCNFLPFLLIRSFSYEVAITSAVFLLFLCLYLFLIYYYTNKNSYVLIFFMALLIALSVGCRPHYILFIPLLILAIIVIERFKGTNITNILKLLLVFSIPCILYGSLLALYNYLRFDSIFEFGRTYQLNGNPIDWHFKIQNLLIGIKYNLFQAPVINKTFPVFSLTQAEGHGIGNEFITGIIYTFPLVLILLLFPFTLYILWKTDKMTSIFLLFLTSISTVIFFVNSSFGGIVQRFLFEYLCILVLLSTIIFYYLYTHTKSVLMKYFLNIFFIAVYIFSIYINISLLFCYENSLFYRASSNGNYETIVDFLS